MLIYLVMSAYLVCIFTRGSAFIVMLFNAEVVKYLLDEAEASTDESFTGDPVNYGNREGRTCLHIAALKDNLPLAEYLVEQHHASKLVKWRHKVSISV